MFAGDVLGAGAQAAFLVGAVVHVTSWGIPHWVSATGRPVWPWLGALKEITYWLITNGPR